MTNDWDLRGYGYSSGFRRQEPETTQAFVSDIVTPPEALPVTVADAQAYAKTSSDDAIFERLIAAVTLETERSVLWRGIVAQRRRLVAPAPLARFLTLEPTNSIVSFTRWTEDDPAVVIPSSDYHVQSSDPAGTVVSLRRDSSWPGAERQEAAYALTYDCGWAAADVPQAIQHMILVAVKAQYQTLNPLSKAGLRSVKIGNIDLKADIPPKVANLGMAYAYRTTIGRGFDR